ncbi:MAG: hypothetical protein ABJE95_07550 [Byssovorax sp.]
MNTTYLLLPIALLVAACGDNLTHPPDRDAGDSSTSTGAGGSAFTCLPNLDGKIDASELAAAFDVAVNYVVSPVGEDRTVNLAGKSDGKGGVAWDFSPDFAADKSLVLEATHVAGKWYASSFPNGDFASPVDTVGEIYGVYSATDKAISLLGIASVVEKPKKGKTLLVYATPIDVYRFPLAPGSSWSTTSDTMMGGMINGLPYSSKDTYQVKDAAIGGLLLHDLTFDQVHKIETQVTLAPVVGGATQTTWQVGFVSECFGEVARATSHIGEKTADFTKAAEVRHLGQ